jgi:hypothetical protein
MRGLTAWGVVLLSALSSGCQVVETHRANTSYYEHDGMWCGNYEIGFEEARVAARLTLAELKMPIYQEGPERQGIFIDTRTPENFEARVVILPPGRHVASTRIGVRVGGFGTHRQVCEHLLDEIAAHLEAVRYRYTVPAVPVAPPGATPSSPPLTAAPPPQAHASEPSLPPQPIPVGRE